MNRHGVINRCKVALGLTAVFTAAAIPAYAIAEGVPGAGSNRPDRAQIGQPQLPSEAALTRNVPSSALRPQNVHLEGGQAAGPAPVETPDSARKKPSRLEP